MKPQLSACAMVLACCAGTASAQEDPDLSALKLADQVQTPEEHPSNWHTYIEAATGANVLRSDGSTQDFQRLSFDLRYDNSFAPGWRAVLSDRLDIDSPAQPPAKNGINTMKEAYLSWQWQSGQILDFGRINERNGVALGYNPTDYFKTNALHSIVSVDPSSLKENREGSVMLKAQKLWDGGSLTALYSPKISTDINNDTFSPDFGRTNNQNRYLLAYSPKISEDINPQFIVFKAAQADAQFGLNLTSLVNDATVVFLEYSGGRSTSLLTQALQQQGLRYVDDSVFRNRVATGLTYTTSNKIYLTAELEYNGGGLDTNQWDALRLGPLPIYGVYRNWLQIVQESPTKRAVFLYGSWQDAMINHLDLSAMTRYDTTDYSRMTWLEIRYHMMNHAEFALQWQRNSGSRFSDYGAVPQSQSLALLGRYYF